MSSPRHALYEQYVREHGLVFESPVRPGANYLVAVEEGDRLYISGQLPRSDGRITVFGKVGAETTLDEARQGARVSTLRSMAIGIQTLGSLDRVRRVLKLGVFVHSAPDFTQQSEVADAASEIIHALFAPDGGHARTSVGVAQLPKNAAVEIEMVLAITPRD